MNRRGVVLAIIALGVSLPLMAQPLPGMPRVGVLIVGTADSSGQFVQAFTKGMAELGYQEGRNVRYDIRYGDGSNEKAAQNARELVSAKVNIIWAPSTSGVAAAQKATMSLPVVFALTSDPVASGFVRSLSQPGTNATGITIINTEMSGKRVQIPNEAFPNLKRIGVLHYPKDLASTAQLPFVQKGVQALGKGLMVAEASGPEEFAAAFDKLAAWRADALIILETTLYTAHRKTLLDMAAKRRWPTINSTKEYVESGGTIAYGADYGDACRRSAEYVDKILKGAKPGNLPVQQPTMFDFVINLRSIRAIGLQIPDAVLQRADRVIE